MIRHPDNPKQYLEIKQIMAPSVPIWAKFELVENGKTSFAFQPIVALALYVDETGVSTIMGLRHPSEPDGWCAVEDCSQFAGYATKLPEGAEVWD